MNTYERQTVVYRLLKFRMDDFCTGMDDSQPKGAGLGGGHHTFIPCGGKSIPCGNSGNMPGGDSTPVSPGGDNARVSPLMEIHRCFFSWR